ncbi:hypothetical protein [Thomasclavelia cocleata]|uniref:hypothetical protein n=1 Tax=Thomasclavelia cocleata TaxID=69824 RepID=UPI00255A7486|nr:hypothetical protein [Thomasclavelia cocleata]
MKWKRFHLEHTDFKKKGIYKYFFEEAIKVIYTYKSSITLFYEVFGNFSFKEFNIKM